jgi:hypothetical protein
MVKEYQLSLLFHLGAVDSKRTDSLPEFMQMRHSSGYRESGEKRHSIQGYQLL